MCLLVWHRSALKNARAGNVNFSWIRRLSFLCLMTGRRDCNVCKIWAGYVPISKSYDWNKFSVVFLLLYFKGRKGAPCVVTCPTLLHLKGRNGVRCRTFVSFYRSKTAYISWKTPFPPKKITSYAEAPKNIKFWCKSKREVDWIFNIFWMRRRLWPQ